MITYFRGTHTLTAAIASAVAPAPPAGEGALRRVRSELVARHLAKLYRLGNGARGYSSGCIDCDRLRRANWFERFGRTD